MHKNCIKIEGKEKTQLETSRTFDAHTQKKIQRDPCHGTENMKD